MNLRYSSGVTRGFFVAQEWSQPWLANVKRRFLGRYRGILIGPCFGVLYGMSALRTWLNYIQLHPAT
jgi:hypothetical protein